MNSKPRKSNNSSGTRFIQRPDFFIDNSQNIVSRDSKPFYSYDSNSNSNSFNNSREKSNPNKSFDSAIFSNPKYITEEPTRLKSYSQNDQENVLDDLGDDGNSQEDIYINVNINKENSQGRAVSGSDKQLQITLQSILQRVQSSSQGVTLEVRDLSNIMNAIESCMLESSQVLQDRDQEVQQQQQLQQQIFNLRKELTQKDKIIHQQRSAILSLQNEISEQKHMQQISRPVQSPSNVNFEFLQQKLNHLEQENELLQIENKQAIKLAVQGRNKKGEKELGDLILKLKNEKGNSTLGNSALRNNSNNSNYQSLLNAQYNRNERKNSTKGSGVNKSFNFF